MKFHHLGIIVNDLVYGERYLKNFSNLKRASKKVIKDKGLGVKILFFKAKNHPLIELIAPIDEKSPVFLTLKKKINLLNHIAYISKKFSQDVEYLKKKGLLQITKPTPAKAFNGKRVVFFFK